MVKKILAVEDNEDNRALIVKVLERLGHEVIEAVSGEKALELVKSDPPDLILMDLGLSGMSGLDVTRIIKADETLKSIPIVALTAYAMVGDKERSLEAGCDGYLSKPINVREFPDQIAPFLGEKDT